MLGKMHERLLLVLSFTAMQCSLWAYDDLYDSLTDPGHLTHDQEQRSNVGSIRHTHTSTRVNRPKNENMRNSHITTVRNYVNSVPSNLNHYFNNSDSQLQTNKSNSKRSEVYEDDRMLYPSDLENLTSINQIKSRVCSYGLCDEVDNYPIEKIERILSRSELKKFFSSETIVSIGNRFGESGENLCSTVSHTRFPKTAKNMQDKEQVIVNVDQYKQGVVFETCKEEGPCNFAENFPNNFAPKCVQQYTVRKLMVVGKESDDTVFDDFKIPSCCVCMVKKIISSRS